MVESGVDPESVGADTEVQRRGPSGEEHESGHDEKAMGYGGGVAERRPAASASREEKRLQESKEEFSMGFDLYDPGDD